MDNNLQHEDLLIKLRAKLNEGKIKLWESPYLSSNEELSQCLQDLANKFSTELSLDYDIVIQALHELQIHSVDRSKANAEYKETGCATFRVKATLPGEKPQVIKVQKALDAMGSELISLVAAEVGVIESRVKLIFNGKVIKSSPSLDEQGVKNGALLMALIMADSPEEVQKQDTMYMEMKATRDDATLLSECVDELADGDEYMKLEDQSGKPVELPPAERRALLVGLALHERGRAASSHSDYSLALVLLLEADRHFSECRSSILQSVDNTAVLQLDIAWCYLRLHALPSALDVRARLHAAETALLRTYRRAPATPTAANERVLLMRLYLLQGIVAYHQNNRSEAKNLLDKAEEELNSLRVDESSVCALVELGWSRAQARCGLRARGGRREEAHHYLAERRAARELHRTDRQQRASSTLVAGLMGMGYSRRVATAALRQSDNNVAEAVRIIQEHRETLKVSDDSSDETPSSDDSVVEPDNKLLAELEAMGYSAELGRFALRHARNHLPAAVELLMGGTTCTAEDDSNPSTSTAAVAKKRLKKHKKEKRKLREEALRRLSAAIRHEEDDYLDSSLVEEEEYLAQYKSLL